MKLGKKQDKSADGYHSKSSGVIQLNNGEHEIKLYRGDEFAVKNDKTLMEYHWFALEVQIKDTVISVQKYDDNDYASIFEVGRDDKESIEAIRKIMKSMFNVTKLKVFVRGDENSGYHEA
jgi:hypothetical protein